MNIFLDEQVRRINNIFVRLIISVLLEESKAQTVPKAKHTNGKPPFAYCPHFPSVTLGCMASKCAIAPRTVAAFKGELACCSEWPSRRRFSVLAPVC
jgi:hypothetical protein